MEPSILIKAALLIAGYFAGNLSPSILISKGVYGKDIRTLGSGNAGTTNMLRNFGKKAAAATLLIDACKGVPFVILGDVLAGEGFGMWCGLAVIAGHIWPVCFGFRGGKGVATTLGCAIFVSPLTILISGAVGLVVIALTRRISPGSLIGSAAFPIAAWCLGKEELILWGVICAMIIWWKHRANIRRILRGEEPKFRLKS